MLNWLKDKQFKVKGQVIFAWAQNKKYDFLLNDYNLIIELDGRQHFKQVSNWISPEKNKTNDELKNKLANDNGYTVIRICQEIVWNDLENWEIILYQTINDMSIFNTTSIIKIGSIYNMS